MFHRNYRSHEYPKVCMYSMKHYYPGILKINEFLISLFLKNKNPDNFILTNNFYLVCAYVCVIPQYQE